VAGALFNLNAHCRTLFSLLDKKGIHLIGECCPVCPLKVKAHLIRTNDTGILLELSKTL
jgi:hypothetical protein